MSGASQADRTNRPQQAESPTAAGGPRRRRSRAERVRLLLAATLGGLAVAFALLNVAQVEVDWILGTWQTPLIVVILVSLLVGATLGFIAAHRLLARDRKAHRRANSGSR